MRSFNICGPFATGRFVAQPEEVNSNTDLETLTQIISTFFSIVVPKRQENPGP